MKHMKQPQQNNRQRRRHQEDLSLFSHEEEAACWYLHQFRNRSPLSSEQTCALLERLAQGDTTARDRLIEGFLPLVASIALRYRGRGLPLADVLQEGACGLIQATDSFDLTRGTPFTAFASQRIIWAIHRALQRIWVLKLPSEMHAQIDRLNHLTGQLFHVYGCAVIDEPLAQQAHLSREDRIHLQRATATPLSLEAHCPDERQDRALEDKEEDMTLCDQLPDPAPPEHLDALLIVLQDQELLQRALASLPARARHVLILRYGLQGRSEHTLSQVAHTLHLSREQVRQIQARALRLLRLRLSSLQTRTSSKRRSSKKGVRHDPDTTQA